jgi:hypothetical protein
MFYYEENREVDHIFTKIAPSSLLELFEEEEDALPHFIEEIIRFERNLLSRVIDLVSRFGYKINTNSEYIIGRGTDGIVLFSTKQKKEYAIKILLSSVSEVDNYDLESFSYELLGRALLVEAGLKEHVLPIITSISEGNLCVLVMDFVSSTLDQVLLMLSDRQRKDIIAQLDHIYNICEQKYIAIGDIAARNIACILNRKTDLYTIKLFDLSAVRLTSDDEYYDYHDAFVNKYDDLLKNLQK